MARILLIFFTCLIQAKVSYGLFPELRKFNKKENSIPVELPQLSAGGGGLAPIGGSGGEEQRDVRTDGGLLSYIALESAHARDGIEPARRDVASLDWIPLGRGTCASPTAALQLFERGV